MPIHVLPPEVANQIAAGEVIERPASVVKELIENALDAGARTISIDLSDGGRRLIRVSDNGCGIPAEEVELAFCRYATSKLATVEDLEHIATLGFRGEALASIASVSYLTAVTRAVGEPMGTRLRLEGGRTISRETVGAPQGTVVTVENLFFNVPARLKFLKKDTTERQLVNALVSRYGLAYPGVRFVLSQGGQEVLHTTGSGNLRDALIQTYGVEVASQMLEIPPLPDEALRQDLPAIKISGFVGLPSLNRSNRNSITLFVNGRWVQDAGLTYAVIQAYHTMLMTGRYPVAVILIALPPEEVDVNVHPTKAQVRFRNPEAVFSVLQRAVRSVLVEQAPPLPIRGEFVWGSSEWAIRRERLAQITSARMGQLGLDVEGEEVGQRAHQRAQANEKDRSNTPPETDQGRTLPMLRVVGQVGATYIVAEGPRGLYLIDQHAAHERILYEQFMSEHIYRGTVSQNLLQAVTVELLPEQMTLVEESLETLHSVGFGVEVFGRNTVRLQAVPALIAQGDPVEAFLAALGEIECGQMPVDATVEERLIARVCKQVAVKAGQVLSYAEMEALVRQLERCHSPQSCPHGRPTMLHLSAEQLAKEFGRLGAI
jgi:DNA mismatch repair protein MutL